MAGQQKPTLEDYVAEVLGLGTQSGRVKAATLYNFNMRSAQSAAQQQSFIIIVDTLRQLPATYLDGDTTLLFHPREVPHDLSLKVKSFNSVIDKLYRYNVLFNKRWPEPPKDGALTLENLYLEIDDLLRTRLVCRYLDGPKFVCDGLARVCVESAIETKFHAMSTDAGYYAWHFYFRVPVELSIQGVIETKQMWVEVQLTTQLAEVITSLTHGLYEDRRTGIPDDPHWKWDAASARFRSSFLGHGLHLLEGVIQSFRDEVFRERRDREPQPILPVRTEREEA